MNTRDKILNGAQKLFLENGYTKTTLRMVAKQADVNLGLLPYYFEKKENMGAEIYSRYMAKLYEKINYKEFQVRNSIEHMLLTYLMLQYYLNLEPGLLKLYVELIKEDVLKYSMESYSFKSLELIEQEFDLDLENNDLTVTINIIKGVERALVMGKMDEKLDMSYFDINVNLVKCPLLYMGIDRKTIDENVVSVRKKMMEKNIDFNVFEKRIDEDELWHL